MHVLRVRDAASELTLLCSDRTLENTDQCVYS